MSFLDHNDPRKRLLFGDEPRDWNRTNEPIPLSMRAATDNTYLRDDDAEYGPPGNRKPGVVEFEVRKAMEAAGNGNMTGCPLVKSKPAQQSASNFQGKRAGADRDYKVTTPEAARGPVDSRSNMNTGAVNPFSDMTGIPIKPDSPGYLQAQRALTDLRKQEYKNIHSLQNMGGNKRIAEDIETYLDREFNYGNGLIEAFKTVCPKAAEMYENDLSKAELEANRTRELYRRLMRRDELEKQKP